jgi:copper(I)-binding protein
MNTRATTRIGILLVASALALSGCATTAPAAEETVVAGDSVTIADSWVKAAESGMSAGFGVLTNDSDTDVTVVSAASPASSMLELHETVENDSGEMVMQPVEGFTIPAGGDFALEPGANHIMFMDLTAPLVAGDEVEITLTFSDGSTFTFTAPVKEYSGANETYEGDMDMDMEGDN